MKAKDVQIGKVYAIMVAANITGVRITEENPYGGWSGININTNKPIRIRTASRIRGLWNPEKPHTLSHAEKQDTISEQTTIESRSRQGSGLAGAIKVLADAGEPLGCKEIVARMLERGYWHTNGLTPAATIYASMLREIKNKGTSSRFVKVDKGKFILAVRR
jgi:hypothetical protein